MNFKKILLISILIATPLLPAAQSQNQHDYTHFDGHEYNSILERIKALNSEIYDDLIAYTSTYHEPAFFKATDESSATVKIPSLASHGYPRMILPSTYSDDELALYLASYKALKRVFIPNPDDFPDDEYQGYMKIIKELDPLSYQNLLEQELHYEQRPIKKGLTPPNNYSFL